MKRRVRLLRRAKNDVRVITAWIAERSKPGAERWVSALDKGLDSIDEFPESHSLAEEDDGFPNHTIRQFFFKTRRGRTYRVCSQSSATRFTSFASGVQVKT